MPWYQFESLLKNNFRREILVLQKTHEMRKYILLTFFIYLNFSLVQLIAQEKHYQGTWTMIETTYVFKFDLYLKHDTKSNVVGHFDWKVTNYDKHSPSSKDYYEPKLGSTAKEFVRGTFDPATKEYYLQGYKKEDPHRIISTDHYRLKVDGNGDIGGDSKAHNTWKGRINGKTIRNDLALKLLSIDTPTNQLTIGIELENNLSINVY